MMNSRMVFCPECRKDVKYTLREQTETATLKGESFDVVSKIAYCDECGIDVYVPEIEDENLKNLYDAYRKRHNIISLADIRAIPEKYNMGKRPLSLLLGWGEQTFSRYYDGDMPSRQYSEEMKRILSDPTYFLSILESGKEKLKSDKAYEKSKAATENLIRVPSSDQSKLGLVAEYLIYACQDITPLALQKALYYIQGFSYAFFKKFIFEEDCEAWVHGPVYRDIYRRFSEYCFSPINMMAEPDVSSMPAEEKAMIDSIVKHVCCYSGKTLESFTHVEMPWISARGSLPEEASTNRIIPKQLIGEYFASVKEKYCMLTSANIKDYAQDLFSKF